jgi:hypothetical protein
MPFLFSYGSLQQADVQQATFGRRLTGRDDALAGWEPSQVKIDDPAIAARVGRSHHANLTCSGTQERRVPGMVFEVSESELASVDGYEAAFDYVRVAVVLASGRHAWAYVHASSAPTGAQEEP